MNKEQIRQALARGYCAPANSSKIVDPVLMEAMADEVLSALRPGEPVAWTDVSNIAALANGESPLQCILYRQRPYRLAAPIYSVPADSVPEADSVTVSREKMLGDLVYIYWSAYHAGHHDTVEGRYTDVFYVDRRTYWADKIEEMLEEGEIEEIVAMLAAAAEGAKQFIWPNYDPDGYTQCPYCQCRTNAKLLRCCNAAIEAQRKGAK